MAAETLQKKTTGATSLTDVTLASIDDKGPSNKDVLFACNVCDKSYDKKSSYHSHVRTKHRATKELDVEKGTKTTQKSKGISFSQWIENETERPLLLTRELDSFLDNQSNASLVAAVRESEEAADQADKLVVKDHEVEWFEEDNMEEFGEEFRSDFASSLMESLPPSQPRNKVTKFHNDLMKKTA